MANRSLAPVRLAVVNSLFALCALNISLHAQGVAPYPNAVTDRLIHTETPMAVPAKGVVFSDLDFGSRMVRVTDDTTNFRLPGTPVHTDASGKANEWSRDGKKFYVLGKGGSVFAFAFDPKTMGISSLPNAAAGQGLLLPVRPGPTFSFVDPDLIYGTTNRDPLTVTSYRFSTGALQSVVDTRTCGVQPPLGSGPSVRSDDDVSLALSDNRVSISEGGPSSGKHMFVIVYDKKLGCRWYNTQTGQMGGQWGTSGLASVPGSYLIQHAYLSRSGQYVVIYVNYFGWYVWNVATLKVIACADRSGMDCEGYGVQGYNAYINGPAVLDDMQTVKRPLNNLSNLVPLYYPLPSPGNWGQPQHFTWSNLNSSDNAPVCGSTYSYDGDMTTDQPFAGEIFCIETDGVASTIWRFAHNRAQYVAPYLQTQPLGNVSRDGRWFLFTSDWDGQLGLAADGTPDSAVFLVKLN